MKTKCKFQKGGFYVINIIWSLSKLAKISLLAVNIFIQPKYNNWGIKIFLIVNIGPDGPRVLNEGIGNDIVLLVLHIDIVTGNSLLDTWCQQESSQLKNFSKNPCRIKDSSFLEVLQSWSHFHFLPEHSFQVVFQVRPLLQELLHVP